MWQRKYRVNYDKNTTEYVYNLPRYNEFERFLNVNEEPLYDTIPVRKGYTFKGWALSSEATEPLADNKVPLNLTTFTLNLENNYYEATVYAVWERNANCTVTYKAGEGNGADVTDTVATGSKTTVREGSIFTPSVGMEFDCWLCDTDGYSVTPGDEISVNDDIVYTAQWKTAYYTLQYDKGNVTEVTGTLPAGRSDITWADLRAGGVFISEEKPQAEGYTFTGWKITNSDDDSIFKVYDASKFGSMTDSEKQVNEVLFDSVRNATAVAQWQANTPDPATYTVTYKDSVNSSASFTDADISGDYTLLGIGDTGFTAPEGMRFDKWSLVTPDDKGYPVTADAGDSINVISDVTYEAVWSASSPVSPTAIITYTSGLTEDYPGYNESCAGTFVINDVPTSAEYAVLGNDPRNENNPSFAPDGYTFAGWKLVSGTGNPSPRPTAASGGAGADGLYHEGDTIATDDLASGSVTLKAMWQVNLKYDANGGTGDIPENGEAVPLFVDGTATVASGGSLTRSGAGFDHWNTKPNDNGTKYQPGQNMVMKENTVLYAIYTDSPGDDTGSTEPDGTTFTLTYKANGGTGNVPDEKTYSAGATVTVASKGDLVRTGCTFKEWNTSPDGSGQGYKGDGSASFVINSDTTLYAIWTDGSGKIVPSPGTGESSLPIIIALNALLLSLAAFALITARARGKAA